MVRAAAKKARVPSSRRSPAASAEAPAATAEARSAAAANQPDHQQQQNGADWWRWRCGDEAGTEMDAKPRQHPAADEGADLTDQKIADQTKRCLARSDRPTSRQRCRPARLISRLSPDICIFVSSRWNENPPGVRPGVNGSMQRSKASCRFRSVLEPGNPTFSRCYCSAAPDFFRSSCHAIERAPTHARSQNSSRIIATLLWHQKARRLSAGARPRTQLFLIAGLSNPGNLPFVYQS